MEINQRFFLYCVCVRSIVKNYVIDDKIVGYCIDMFMKIGWKIVCDIIYNYGKFK